MNFDEITNIANDADRKIKIKAFTESMDMMGEMIAIMRDGLVSNGFTREEAIDIAMNFMTVILDRDAKGKMEEK